MQVKIKVEDFFVNKKGNIDVAYWSESPSDFKGTVCCSKSNCCVTSSAHRQFTSSFICSGALRVTIEY